MKGDRERCLAADMDGYISKPINRKELITLVEGVACSDVTKQESQLATPAESAEAPAPWSAAGTIERLGGDEALARQLVSLFLGEYPKLLSTLRDSFATGSADDVRRAAHAAKGCIANFVEGGPQATALRIETLAAEGRLEEALPLVAQLDRQLTIMVRSMHEFEQGASCVS
jgi:HPt (histidine-containing phosphotransfer) domain-containing protein